MNSSIGIAPANSIQGVVESSTRLAEAFVTRYYQAQDLPPADRALSLQPLYAQTAKISWNGNPIGWNDVPGFAQAMPVSKTDVQAFDCHPISESAHGGNPPSLVVTVSGQVSHGASPTPSAGSINSKNFDNLPRVFSQSFILTFVGQGGEQGYVIASDSFRFC